MEYPFSSSEKGYDHSLLPRGRMEGTTAVSTSSNFEDSFVNVAELMNFDTYAGWFNSPSNLVDQMFSSFASSPPTAASPNLLAADGLNFTQQHNSGVSMADNGIVGSSFVNGDKVMFNHVDSPLAFSTSSANDEFNLYQNDRISRHNLIGDVGNDVIPRPLPLSLSERMLRALNLFKEWSGGGILAQVWAPIKNGDQYILSTCEQPYLLDQTLSGYREVSRLFTFSAESKPGSISGLPGRVFASRIPEWTSNVMYYTKSEYLRVHHAVDHEVRGCIAIPVIEDESLDKPCCAVLELVTMKEKSDFDSEMENVCRALQAVNLRSTASPRLYSQSLSENQRAALAEITDVLRAVCHAHRLPLALTWIPCSYTVGPGEGTMKTHPTGFERNANEKRVLCIEDTACYVNDNDTKGFVRACLEHYLEEGQGIVGKALQSNHPFFYPDVKEYHVRDYPLVHHARKFGLNAAVAIRLRSTYTGDHDYILEFFLPVNMKGSTEQQLLLNNLSSTMQRICKSLRTVSDTELNEMEGSGVKLLDTEMRNVTPASLPRRSSEHSFTSGSLSTVNATPQNVYESTNSGIEADGTKDQNVAGLKKQMQKKRSTAEKHVSLSVIQQYFSGSLKDAAKSIGVCPTTLKRICRQHGISRWPSRKINKVNRSLKKIQSVLESVQGVEGGLKLNTSMGALLAAGPIIQEYDSRKAAVQPDLNQVMGESAPAFSGMDIETAIVKMEEQCLLLDRSKVIGQHDPGPSHLQSLPPLCIKNNVPSSTIIPSAPPRSLLSQEISSEWVFANQSHFLSQNSAAGDEIDTTVRDDNIFKHKQLTSSVMTDSSDGSGSMMHGCSSNSRSDGKGQEQNRKSETSFGDSLSTILVKATYKENTVRFKFETCGGCFHLYEEIAKRFKLQVGHFQLKYLDDEEEWVLLVSDSDLQECVDIMDCVGTRTVKFLVRDVPSTIGSSGGSNCILGEGS